MYANLPRGDALSSRASSPGARADGRPGPNPGAAGDDAGVATCGWPLARGDGAPAVHSTAMRRFASLFPFVEAGSRQRTIGRLVANHDFVRALLCHGRFDEYLFSNPSPSNLAAFETLAREWLTAGRPRRLECVSYAQLAGRLESAPPDVMHLGGWGHFMPGVHYLRTRLAQQGWPVTGIIHSLTGRESVDHAVRLNRAQLRESDAIFCTSRDGRTALERLLEATASVAGRRYRGRLVLLPLGVDDALVRDEGDRDRGRARLRIGAEDVVLLVLGRMTPAQKMDLGPLLLAFARRILPASRVPMTLVVAGGASPADIELVTLTAGRLGLDGRVRLHPNFSPAHRADLLAMSDILVSPVDNAQETFGLSVLEAQGAGLPVVASRFDGYKDLVREGIDGFLVDTCGSAADPADAWFDLGEPNVVQLQQAQGVAVDLDQLAGRVLTLAHDRALRQTFGAAGRDKVAREFVWSAVIPKYEAVWDDLARAARHEPATAPEPNPFNLAPAPHFSHYASRQLSDEDEVVATGESPAEGAYTDVAPWLPADVIEEVASAARRPVAVGTILRRSAADPLAVRYVVRWMLKHGMLRVHAPR